MDSILSQIETRVLGALIEKQITTPDYYPLTLNALTIACNQKSNRDPVLTLEETTVVRVLDDLREKKLAWRVTGVGSRVPKYRHDITNVYKLSPQEVAIVCVLFLRGPQTPGELRSRTSRLYEFDNLEEVETTLIGLMEREDPYVIKLPREIGRREQRYAHLFSGEVKIEESEKQKKIEDEIREEVLERDRKEMLDKMMESLSQEERMFVEIYYGLKDMNDGWNNVEIKNRKRKRGGREEYDINSKRFDRVTMREYAKNVGMSRAYCTNRKKSSIEKRRSIGRGRFWFRPRPQRC